MSDLIDELDIPGLIKEHCGTTNSNRRGNLQKHFGSSGSQNVGLPENDDMTRRYFGATYPRNNRESHSQGAIRAQEVASEIGKLMNIDFCQEDYLDHHPQHRRYFDFVSTMAGTKMAKFCAFSLTVLPLTMSSKVNRHTDKENCPQFTASMIVSQNVYCPLQRIWNRINAIFYMRKATFDMCIRVSACEEAAKCSMKWIAQAEKYQLPTRVPILDVPQYHKNVGSEGMYITVDRSSNRIVSLALRSKACADKQGNFLAPMVCSILHLMEHNSIHFPTEFIELVSVIGHLCSVYVFVTVLHMMQTDWDHQRSKHQKGGLVEYIFDRMKDITGCVSGGPGRRCMNFLNRNFPVRDIKSNCLIYRHLIATLLAGTDNQLKLTDKQKKEAVHKITKHLSQKVKWAGTFSVIHVVQTLALLGIAPGHFLDFVLISTGTSQHKKKETKGVNRNKRKRGAQEHPGQTSNSPPTGMEAYLNMKGISQDMEESSSSSKTSSKSGRLSVVLSSLTRYLRVILNNPNLTEATAENILCEATRKEPAEDLYFPGHGFFRRCVETNEWCRVTPWIGGGNELFEYVSEEIQDPTEWLRKKNGAEGATLVSSTISCQNNNVIWQKTVSDEKLDEIVDIGKKSEKSNKYIEITINGDQMGQYPSLLMELKRAMACRQGSKNDHSTFMERINSLPQLSALIANHQKAVQIPGDDSAPRPKGGTTPVDNWQEKTVQFPGEDSAPSPKGGATRVDNWQRGTLRVHGDISYRHYQSKIQAQGTILENGWRNWNKAADFTGVHVFPWSTPHNDAQYAMNIGRNRSKVFPRFKLNENITLSKATRKANENTGNKAKREEEKCDEQWCYHASLHYLPDGVMGGSNCCVQERLAHSLGGFKKVVDETELKCLWFFDTPDLAVQHLMFSIICLVGSTPFYKRLRRRALAKFGGSKKGKVAVVGYSVVGCKPTPPGTIAYYLLTNTGETDDGDRQPQLVIAFPTRRIKGNKKKRGGKKENVLFVRLM